MSISKIIEHDTALISIEGDLTIYEAQEVSDSLFSDEDYFDKQVTINLACIEEVDCAGIQIIMVLRNQIASNGGSFEISAMSESITAVLSLLNIAFTVGGKELTNES